MNTPEVAEVQTSSLGDQLAAIRSGLAGSPVTRRIVWASLAILVIIVATAFGQVMLNRWNRPFYDAIQRRDLAEFLHQLMVFAAIAGGLLVLNIGQQWLNQRIRLRLREALTADLIEEWMRPNRAFPSPMPVPSASIRTSACSRMRRIFPISRRGSPSDSCRR